MPACYFDSNSDQNDGVLCNENSPIDLYYSTGVDWMFGSPCLCIQKEHCHP